MSKRIADLLGLALIAGCAGGTLTSAGAAALKTSPLRTYPSYASAAQPAARPTTPQRVATPFKVEAASLKVEPASLTLEDARDERRVIVSARQPDGFWLDVTEKAILHPLSSLVQIKSGGYIAPVARGKTGIRITVGKDQVILPVEVRSAASPPISFVREVMPTLSKIGCNAGTCHGSARGKDGFKLSLRGYDPDFDYHALIDDISCRRFNRVVPSQSLFLLKPTEQVPHQGGLVVELGSRQYELLYHWVLEGVHSDTGKVSRANRLEILPAQIKMALPGQHQQMLVIAHYPDGATRDVTRDAVFTSSVPDVATISPDGLVKAVRRGEAAILVRYEGNYAAGNLLVMGDRRGFKWSAPPTYNYIDALVYRKLQKVKIEPSEVCTDAEFLRRVSLDLTGLPPAPDTVRQFIADPTPQRVKREKLVDRLLASPEYVDNWTNKWADLLDCNQKYLGKDGVVQFHDWIHQAVKTNTPYDRFVHELIAAEGSSATNPAADYMRILRDPSTATESVTQLFLGTRFSCNKCHDHPFERWTQQQYYQFGAFFAKLSFKPGKKPDEEIIGIDPAGTVIYPRDGRPAAAVFPFAAPTARLAMAPHVSLASVSTSAPAAAASPDPRVAMADWLTSANNPLFAKAMANRLWSYFFGKGIIDPVDDIRSGNPPSNPALLDALTADFVKSGFDLKHMMRTICLSRTYQLSLKTNRFNSDDQINFSHAIPRRLTAEELLDSIDQATGSQAKIPGAAPGERADELPGAKIDDGGSFLALFGSPPRETPCECERTSQVSLGQALNLVNGPTISDAIADPNGRIAALIKANVSDAKLVEEIFLAALCRMPTPKEAQESLSYLKKSPTRADGAQDLMWALLTSPGFLFNH